MASLVAAIAFPPLSRIHSRKYVVQQVYTIALAIRHIHLPMFRMTKVGVSDDLQFGFASPAEIQDACGAQV
ncbi:MAG: hypothetical protein ACK44T_00210 [Sphingomonadales bacterium]|jgi:hypothetical protein